MSTHRRPGPVPTCLLLAALAAAGGTGSLAPAAEEPGTAGDPAARARDGPAGAGSLGPAGAGSLGPAEPPPEYRSAALPLENRETRALVERAEAEAAAGEWGRAFAALDEALARVTAPAARRRPGRPAKSQAEASEADDGAVGEDEFWSSRLALDGTPASSATSPPAVAPTEECLTRDGIRFVPAAANLRQRLLEFPAEARAVYASLYEAPARQALERARELPAEQALRELRRAAERYPLTRAGAEAWSAVAARLLESGRFREASRALAVRLELPFSDADGAASALVELAAARALAGDAAGAEQALERLVRDHAAAAVMIRGERVAGRDAAGHPLLRGLLAGARPAAAEAAWVAAGGSFDHAAFPAPGLPPLGSRPRWIQPPEPEPERKGPENQPSGEPPSPVSHGGLVHVRRAGELLAIDARSGKIVWSAAPGALRRETATVPAERSSYSGPLPEPGIALQVREDGSGKAAVIGIDAVSAPAPARDGRLRWAANLLVAYEARSGKLAWSASGPEDEEDGPLAFAGTPVVAAGLVVVAAFQGDSVHAAAFTAGGRRAWTRRLYVLNQHPQAGPPRAPLLAASGDTIVAGGNGGLACALEAAAGVGLGASRYRNTGEEHRASFLPVAPPVIAGGAAILAPADSDAVTAFDLASGAIRWERPLETWRHALIGADAERVYIAGRKVAAFGLADGEPAWESEAAGQPPGRGILAAGRLLVAALDGELSLLDARDGRVLSRLRIADPRLAFPAPLQLAVAGGSLVAASPVRLFALEAMEDSWAALGGAAGGRLFEKARLLQAEGRHEEALAVWKEIRKRGFPEHLRPEVEGGMIAAAEAAARTARDHAPIRELLADESLVRDRRRKMSLQLLLASLLERDSAAEAAAVYRELLVEEGALVPLAAGFEVDAGSYASGRLLALDTDGVAGAEAAAIGELLHEPETSGPTREARDALALQAVRRPHLRESAEGLARLARAAEREGDTELAAELLDTLLADRPRLAAERRIAEKARQLAGGRARAPVSPGLDAVLAEKGLPLTRRFWLASDEGLLAETAVASEPLPFLAVLAGGSLRFHDPEGKLLGERTLRDFPDVSAARLTLEATFEEPAIARLDRDGLLLFTAAGMYAYRGPGLAAEGGDDGSRHRELKLAWASTWPHPLTALPANARSARSLTARGGGNTFAELVFARDGRPLVLGRDGVLSTVDARTGKLGFQLHPPQGGAPVSPPVIEGARVLACFANPPGIQAYRVPGAGPGRGDAKASAGKEPPLFIAGPAEGFRQGGLAAGGLIAVFAGQAIEALEAASGRVLWKWNENAGSIVHARARELWLSLPDGALAVHSARSGELEAKVPLPAGADIIEVLEGPLDPGTQPGGIGADGKGTPPPAVSTLLVLLRASGRGRAMGEGAVGRGLQLVALGPRREKVFAVEVEKGPVTFGGARALAGGGWLLFYNTERQPGKWQTRGTLITPAGAVREVFAAELTGKGIGQPPRIAVLRGGLGVGNADGFGWFGPRAAEAPAADPGGLGTPPGRKKG